MELLLAGWAESKRLADYNNPGSQGDGSFLGITDGLKGQSNGYPGASAPACCVSGSIAYVVFHVGSRSLVFVSHMSPLLTSLTSSV